MESLLLVLEAVVSVLLVGAVLLQPSDSSLGNIRSGDLLSSRSATTFLARLTAVLACAFFALCLGLSVLSCKKAKRAPIDHLPISSQTERQRPLPQDTERGANEKDRKARSGRES